MIFLPIELLSCIFDLTSKQDQLKCQFVCNSWHVPAKRAFYSKITIEGKHDDLNYNNLIRFKKFIECISQSNDHLPTPGQFIQSLIIRFDIALETKFMPTDADFQLLATASPNLQELQFPSNMFWNNVMSIDNQHYWKRLRKVSQFKVMASKQSLDKFLYFKSTLSYLHIAEWQSSRQDFIEMIKSFTHLETLKITTRQRFTNLYNIIPTLIECPNITQLIMTSDSTTSTNTNNNSDVIVPKLQQLRLTLNSISSQLLFTLTHSFPNLHRLMLHFSQPTNDVSSWSDDLQLAMSRMIQFLTRMHQAHLDLFVPDYLIMHHLVRQFYAATKPKLYITYDSCSSFTTGQPDLSYHKHGTVNQIGRLDLRYQGHLPAGLEVNDLPHMSFLQDNGCLIDRLSIQLPSSFLGHSQFVQSIFTNYCPNLKVFNLVQGSFDMDSSATKFLFSQLIYLSMERSLITSSSLYHLSKLYATSLYYLKLEHCRCSESSLENITSINMPFTQFKKLVIIQDYRSQDTDNPVLVSVFEKKVHRTTLYYYMARTEKLVPTTPSVIAEYHFEKQRMSLDIVCYSLNQLHLNSCHIVL
ncbi:hypothetical protein INT46_003947 [Mucor plumbeus]|uniref:F-box domain-containing protein n=1 Tax=Mucor plumbeus TaxID=97098 RepID=A0A8H7VCU5_9FUNG|nr:hypothetical protein INT46_003947 [Mucor plumbeus]